jgi:hypothetical protein
LHKITGKNSIKEALANKYLDVEFSVLDVYLEKITIRDMLIAISCTT